jgi:hypothetical protein
VRERAGDLLRELASLELILERRLHPGLAYMFKRALTQDAAYASLLIQRRRELPGLVGLAIEETIRGGRSPFSSTRAPCSVGWQHRPG